MPLLSILREVFGVRTAATPAKGQSIARVTRAERRRENRNAVVDILRERGSANRQKHIDWLTQRREDIGSGSGTPPDDGAPPDQGEREVVQAFQGKMPVRATAEALAFMKALKADEGFDRIQFPPVFRHNEKIVAVLMSDRTRDRLVGVVEVRYENDVNPASADKLGVTLDLDRQSGMLHCHVLYPAIPTGLAARTQPSSLNQ